MTTLMFAMLAWISANTGYNLPKQLPNIVMVEPYQLCQRYGVYDQKNCNMLKVKGVYDKAFTIYLSYQFEPGNIEDRSRLLHELVHWVQWANGKNELNHCMGNLEVEAYELQDKWRAQYGLEAKRDEFTMLMLEAACEG